MVIIGMVGALTIPALKNSIEETHYKISTKRIYSVVSEALTKIKQDYGGDLRGVFTNDTQTRNILCNELNCVKTCDNSTTEGCFTGLADAYFATGSLSWSQAGWQGLNGRGFITADGTQFVIDKSNSNCNYVAWNTYKLCAFLFVDINGFKAPNKLGKDIHYIYIVNNERSAGIPGYPGLDERGCTPSTGDRCEYAWVFTQ